MITVLMIISFTISAGATPGGLETFRGLDEVSAVSRRRDCSCIGRVELSCPWMRFTSAASALEDNYSIVIRASKNKFCMFYALIHGHISLV